MFFGKMVCRERPQKEPRTTKCLKYVEKNTISDTCTWPLMGHQWTIKKTPPGPRWRQMGAKENTQTVDFKRFFFVCVFSGQKQMSFWSSKVPKRYKNKAFGAPEAPNVVKIKLLELQKLQTL